ncbi:VRR-NUC domain-containing protein [Leadbetterella byssophila]|uniref:VRR-NUC domain-containing protein n=1 Tax=Leadbetterella byssophila TaxID=316068 RepID=UPI0039A24649
MYSEESEIQIACVAWFNYQYPQLSQVLIHVPNGRTRPKKTKRLRDGRVIQYSPEGKKLKQEGLRKGTADLLLLTPRQGYGALCIEMKKPGGVQSPSQKEWQRLAEKNGNKYVVCRSLEEFMQVIRDYLVESPKLVQNFPC